MNRFYRIDLLRIIAFILVVFLHYWSFQGLYDIQLVGAKPFVHLLFRNFAMICVPIFIVITGYLNCHKTPGKNYLFGLKKVVFVYLLCSVVISFATLIYHKGKVSLVSEFLKILRFDGSGYAWYVEMYIGLYMIIPLLNICWQKVDHKYILFVISCLTIIPDSINWYDFSQGHVLLSTSYNKICPEWWDGCYPLFYYFIGCYLREHGWILKKSVSALIILISDILMTVTCFIASNKGLFVWGKWQDYSSIFVVAMVVCFFGLLCPPSNRSNYAMNDQLHKMLINISEATYGAYLLSYLFDNTIYTIGNRIFCLSPTNAWLCFLYVPIICVCSIGMSHVLLRFYRKVFIRARGTIA